MPLVVCFSVQFSSSLRVGSLQILILSFILFLFGLFLSESRNKLYAN